jgi:hypothetical protein
MEALMQSLIIWISVMTGLPPSPPPSVTYMTQPEMFEIKQVVGVAAFYDHNTETVVLPKDFDQLKTLDISILVHELVHHLQYRAGLDYECYGAREALAYDTQESYLEAAGLSLSLIIGPLLRMVIVTCRPEGTF